MEPTEGGCYIGVEIPFGIADVQGVVLPGVIENRRSQHHRLATCLEQDGKKNGDEDGDDGDHDEQLHQRKGIRTRLG